MSNSINRISVNEPSGDFQVPPALSAMDNAIVAAAGGNSDCATVPGGCCADYEDSQHFAVH